MPNPNTKQTYTKNPDGTYTQTVSFNDQPKDFSFLYDAYYKNKSGSGIIDVVSDGVKVSKVSDDNKYYHKTGYKTGNNAGSIVVANKDKIIKGDWGKSCYNKIKLLDPQGNGSHKCVLSNCVGYVVSRINEVWGLAIETGYIKYDTNKKQYITKDGIPITGAIKIPKLCEVSGAIAVPNKNAWETWSVWPSKPGWEKTAHNPSTDKKKVKPGCFKQCCKPGSILCVAKLDYSGCGHVMFVEKVIDSNTIVISQSGYDKYNAKTVVNTKTLKYDQFGAGTGFTDSASHKFVGFLQSPITQLAANIDYVSLDSAGNLPIGTTEDPTLTTTDIIQVGYLIEYLKQIDKKPTPNVGDLVKIRLLGSLTPDDKGNFINYIGGKGKVVSIDKDKSYPYGVIIGESIKPSAYYKENGLILLK